MDDEATETQTGQPTTTTTAASSPPSTRDVARPRAAKRKRGRPKGSKNKGSARASSSRATAAVLERDDTSDDAIESDASEEGPVTESREGRSERYAEGRRAIVDGAPAIERMLTPFMPAVAAGLDYAAGVPFAASGVTIHRTTSRGEPRSSQGTAAEAVAVALSEAIAWLTPSTVVATLDHPLAPALSTLGGVAIAILGSRLAAILATPNGGTAPTDATSDASSPPSPDASAIEVRDDASGAAL